MATSYKMTQASISVHQSYKNIGLIVTYNENSREHREKVFSIISEGIIRETHNSIPQCYYVSGELGYGKTTLLHRIKEKFESQNFQPIYIDCLLHPIPNEEKMEEYLHSVTDHKRAILLIDEAHILLNTWSNQELSKLRALIYSPGAPIIVL